MPRRVDGGFIQFLDRYPDGVAPPDCLILCTGCSQRLPPTEFYVSRAIRMRAEAKRITGTSQRCRGCANTGSKKFRTPKVALIDAARAKGCADCGHVDLEHPEVFDFDHVRPGKVKPVSAYLTSGTIDDMLSEIALCEVVCANCHRIRTRLRSPGHRGRDIA